MEPPRAPTGNLYRNTAIDLEPDEPEDDAEEPASAAPAVAPLACAGDGAPASAAQAVAPLARGRAATSLTPYAGVQGRLRLWEASGRLLLMSWNPGSGCKKLLPVIGDLGYHIVCIQEACRDKLSLINDEEWSWSCSYQQFVAARLPSRVHFRCGEEIPDRIRWSACTVIFGEPRMGRDHFGVLSLHLNNRRAKKTHAGPDEVARVLDEATKNCAIDIMCGDLNMARWNKDLSWHDRTLDILESRDFIPIADYTEECCFIAITRTLAQEHPRSFLAPPATGRSSGF